ncbi:MAG TPA: ABC transporter permease [Methylomusa anaerophila]|uniref:Putative aliphatic sulfonates transport permease protein SsuC n=1 Tax=Methylomusa anaerophila TaxID=1930071 RepID=A0A348AEN7_9FIRM|nr:ABC transporter permease [Methylomusa anaerophila]BBB89535.1 putative aliphatic sulfonates transport permease protein SsuC [Methylomusa anaerophila]HML90095.1 ABC transporter permease [Methylomusa anaerophila]
MVKLQSIRLEPVLERTLAVGLLLLAWELLPRMGFLDARFLPPFSEVIERLVKMIVTGRMSVHLLASLQRSLIGFSLAVALSLPLGVMMGWFKRFERGVDPLLQMSRNTSVLALYPVFILVFGLGELSKVAIIFWGTLWPILINTIEGVKGADPLLIKSARSMGSSQLTLLFKVVLPSAMPSILTGFRLSAARSVLVLVAAEMLGAQKGLGYLIFQAQLDNETPEMYAGIVLIALIGVLLNYTLIRFERHATRWKEQVEAN